MVIDTDRLVTIANELKSLDRRRGELLGELQRIAGGTTAGGPAVPRRGRPPGSRNRPKAPAATRPGATAAPVRKPRKGLTTDVLGLLADGAAYTAGDIVGKLGLQPTKGKIASVSTTLVRLRKEGRVKKDKERGYRAK